MATIKNRDGQEVEFPGKIYDLIGDLATIRKYSECSTRNKEKGFKSFEWNVVTGFLSNVVQRLQLKENEPLEPSGYGIQHYKLVPTMGLTPQFCANTADRELFWDGRNSWFKVEDDSMAPTYNAGDILLINSKRHYPGEIICEGEVHLICPGGPWGEEKLIRRLESDSTPRPYRNSPYKVIVKADNKNIPEEIMSRRKACVFGVVIGQVYCQSEKGGVL